VTVTEFISTLQVHFPTRHDTPQQSAAWIKSMVDALRGTAPDVLQSACYHIVMTRKLRSFPLPSECREACQLAAERIAADRERSPGAQYVGRSLRTPDRPEDIERWRDARLWREQMVNQYGSFDNYLTRTRSVRFDPRFEQSPSGTPIASKKSTFKHVQAPFAYKDDTHEHS